LNELALFAGAGGGILGGKLLGWRTVCAVEYDAYAASVLVARQNDGCLEPFPVWDDVRTFDGRPWRRIAQVVSGGFPCTDISCSGRGAGIEGTESGLWKHMARIVGEIRPEFVFVENSPMLVQRGLAVVISDLAEMGYDAEWDIVGAHHLGAPHKRDRIWIAAYAREQRAQISKAGQLAAKPKSRSLSGNRSDSLVAHSIGAGLEKREKSQQVQRQWREPSDRPQRSSLQQEWRDCCGAQWAVEPGVQRVVAGLAHRVDRLKAIGNGQVPAVAALAWRLLGGPDGDCVPGGGL
jgi:DNA (cytosine-5)-methyltransferase 1